MKISRNESIAKEARTVEIRCANETTYHITNQEEDDLFRLETCPCDLQIAVHNVFYLTEIIVKNEEHM